MILEIINTICVLIIAMVVAVLYFRVQSIGKRTENIATKCDLGGVQQKIVLLDEKVRKLYEWYISREELHTYTKSVVADMIEARIRDKEVVILSEVLKKLICEGAKKTNGFTDIVSLMHSFIFVLIDQIHKVSNGKHVCTMGLDEFSKHMRTALGSGIVSVLSTNSNEAFVNAPSQMVINNANMQPSINSNIVQWIYNIVRGACGSDGVVSVERLRAHLEKDTHVYRSMADFCYS